MLISKPAELSAGFFIVAKKSAPARMWRLSVEYSFKRPRETIGGDKKQQQCDDGTAQFAWNVGADLEPSDGTGAQAAEQNTDKNHAQRM